MRRVRTKTVKKSSRRVIEKYYSRKTLDFHTNTKILEEVAIIPSKRLHKSFNSVDADSNPQQSFGPPFQPTPPAFNSEASHHQF